MTTDLALRFASIEDYLGPASGRFFGSGYRRATHDFGVLRLTHGADSLALLDGTVSVVYPVDWSRKSGTTDLRPHLSSVDVITIAATLSEAVLRHGFGLDDSSLKQSWVTKLVLRAGTAPQEELRDINLRLRCLRTAPRTGQPDLSVSVFECEVGVMRARCEVVHPTSALDIDNFDDITLGGDDLRRGLYGDGYKDARHDVRDVIATMDTLTCTARVGVRSVKRPGWAGGLEAAYQPSLSLIDCFVSALQLVQVLLYELDDIDRAHSNTLWMLQTTLTASEPHRSVDGPQDAAATLAASHLLTLNGQPWRNADVEAHVGDVNLRCSFAHELPGPPS